MVTLGNFKYEASCENSFKLKALSMNNLMPIKGGYLCERNQNNICHSDDFLHQNPISNTKPLFLPDGNIKQDLHPNGKYSFS